MSCQKRAHPSRAAAKKKMKFFNLGNRSAKRIRNVYYCDECEGWHLTSMNKKASRRISRKNN